MFLKIKIKKIPIHSLFEKFWSTVESESKDYGFFILFLQVEETGSLGYMQFGYNVNYTHIRGDDDGGAIGETRFTHFHIQQILSKKHKPIIIRRYEHNTQILNTILKRSKFPQGP